MPAENEIRDAAIADGQFGMAVKALGGIPVFLPLLHAADLNRLRILGSILEWFAVPAGAVLFEEGDTGVDAWIVVEGRLGVLVHQENGLEAVAQIQRGEFVGEMSPISGEPRSATVVALRDSELVRIPAEHFEFLLRTSSEMALLIMRQMATRIRRTSRTRGLSQHIDSIAVVPLSGELADPNFGEHIAEALASLRRSVSIHRDPHRPAGKPMGPAAVSARIGSSREGKPLALYVADQAVGSWTRHAIRQSDRVVFVANADARVPGGTDASVAYAAELHRAADLVLINKRESKHPDGGTGWLPHFPAERIIHIRLGSPGDLAKVARLALRRAVGIVFSGGGARGFAHAGVIRAFAEAGIPIDIAGGTSFGSVAAALIAMDYEPQKMVESLHEAYLKSNPIGDYTIPLIALARGRRMSRLLRQKFGDIRIENLWKHYFCVSANLTTGEAVIHKDGPLWHAIRASGAVPGIVPPALLEGHVLVDGGIMNNFPTNIMAARHRGPVVGVDITGGTALQASASGDIGEKSLLWMCSKGRGQVPGILRILARSGTVNSVAQSIASRAAVDVLILPDVRTIDMLAWKCWEQALEQGYRAGVEAVGRVRTLLATEEG